MRIVSGKFKGRQLATPKNNAIRPTSDRNRETLFNILMHHWPQNLLGAHVLDLFAGTGALGFEALSRGAAHVTFVEKTSAALQLLDSTKTAFKITDEVLALKGDATQLARLKGRKEGQKYDLVFADPPYGKGLAEKAIQGLVKCEYCANNALLVIEEAKGYLPEPMGGVEKLYERTSGQTDFGFYIYGQ